MVRKCIGLDMTLVCQDSRAFPMLPSMDMIAAAFARPSRGVSEKDGG